MTDFPTDEELELGAKAFESLAAEMKSFRECVKEQGDASKNALEASRIAQETLKEVQTDRRGIIRPIIATGVLAGIGSALITVFFVWLTFF